MVNLQLTEPPVRDDGRSLEVVMVWPTIQGEGPFVGRPATFVRFAGCNMQCPACDTDYTTGRTAFGIDDLAAMVDSCSVGNSLVVLTGGEPLRQNLIPFVLRLVGMGKTVQIETNGTLHQMLPWPAVSLVCSPKTQTINQRLMPHINALKYILDADKINPQNGLPLDTLGYDGPPAYPWPDFNSRNVFVQPKDEGDPLKNRRNLDACIRSCMTYGYRLSVQLHKIIGMP